MTVASGKLVYDIGRDPCSGAGYKWSNEELEAAVDGRVEAILFDDEGMANIEEIFADLVDTEFAQQGLKRVLGSRSVVEDWRVGEAIAESYLSEHRSCCFPWPDGRDARKSGSSLPGADLVGLGSDDHGDCLAFGEVKTSSDRNYPPGRMYGPTGLKRQLENLRDNEDIRDNILRYLAHRAGKAKWRPQFENAGKRYLKNKSDVQIYGFLVRDVKPHANDLRARVLELAKDCPALMKIELVALYLPEGSIDGIGKTVISRRGGSAP